MKTDTIIKVKLSQVGSAAPGKPGSIYNQQTREFPDMDAALLWLEQDYGITKPKRLQDSNSVFVDTPAGTRRVGFTVSRWNSDVSHNSKKWWETNWVSFEQFQNLNFSL